MLDVPAAMEKPSSVLTAPMRWATPRVVYGAMALLFAGLVLRGHAARFWVPTVDDAGITFAYLETWLQGGGLAIRPGEPKVEGYTNALWLFLLAPFGLLAMDVAIASKGLAFVLAGVAALGTFLAVAQVARRHLAYLAAVVASVALLYPQFIGYWFFAGLENALFSCLLTWALYFAVADETRESPSWRGPVVQALLVMTRPDGLLPVAGIQLGLLMSRGQRGDARVRWRDHLRRWWSEAVRAGGLFLLYFVPKSLYFGDWMPNSYRAKTPIPDAVLQGLRYVGAFEKTYQVLAPLMVATLLALMLRRTRRLAVLALCALLPGIAFPIVAGGDWMPQWRLLTFAWGASAVLLGVGLVACLEVVSDACARMSASRWAQLLAVGMSASLLAGAVMTIHARWSNLSPPVPMLTLPHVAKRGAFFERMAAGAGLLFPHVADPDAGGTTWRRPFAFTDLGRLADIRLASLGADDFGYTRSYLLHERRPDLLHLHGAWHRHYGTERAVEFRPGYAEASERFGRGVNWIAIDPLSWPTVGETKPSAGTGRLEVLAALTDGGVTHVLIAATGTLPPSVDAALCDTEQAQTAKVPVVWGGGVVRRAALASRADAVTGVVSLPRNLSAQCVRLTGSLGQVRVEKARIAERAAVLAEQYLRALSQDPLHIFVEGMSPLEPAMVRLQCRGDEACVARLRSQTLFEAYVERVLPRARLRVDSGDLEAAAHWLLAMRRASGQRPITMMPAAFRDLSERTAAGLEQRARVAREKGARMEALAQLSLSFRVTPDHTGRARRLTRWLANGSPLPYVQEWGFRDALTRGQIPPGDVPRTTEIARSYLRVGDVSRAYALLRASGDQAALSALRAALDTDAPLGHPWGRLIDFEAGLPPDARVVGAAFGSGPVTTKLPGQQPVKGYSGRAFLNGYHGGDASTGRFEMRLPKLDARYVVALIGGGPQDKGGGFSLSAGEKTRWATHSSARSEYLNPQVIDARGLAGQSALVRLRDNTTKAWGHMTADGFYLIP